MLDSGHHRRSIRLHDYDYTQMGAYFVTLCTYKRHCTLGHVDGDRVILSAIGHVVEKQWLQTAIVRPNIKLDMFVVMPNHLHGIIWITADSEVNDVGATGPVAPTGLRPTGPKPGSLGAIVAQFKRMTAVQVNQMNDTPGHSLWQRGYYDRIIRSEDELNRIRTYILTNPSRWAEDAENPS